MNWENTAINSYIREISELREKVGKQGRILAVLKRQINAFTGGDLSSINMSIDPEFYPEDKEDYEAIKAWLEEKE